MCGSGVVGLGRYPLVSEVRHAGGALERTVMGVLGAVGVVQTFAWALKLVGAESGNSRTMKWKTMNFRRCAVSTPTLAWPQLQRMEDEHDP